jgi:hypothetical protein
MNTLALCRSACLLVFALTPAVPGTASAQPWTGFRYMASAVTDDCRNPSQENGVGHDPRLLDIG